MAATLADRFINALSEVERTNRVESMVDLFADNCRMTNLALKHPLDGKSGCEHFWKAYRGEFHDIRSEFTHREENDHCVVLEWVSHGTLRTGQKVDYQGVSIIEHDGSAIRSFRSYYDSQALRTRPA